jgi:general secretion pathway protein C
VGVRDPGTMPGPNTGKAANTQLNTQELISRWSSQSGGDLAAKASEHLPTWVSLMLVIGIAWYLARVVWLVYPVAGDTLWVAPQSAPTGQAGGRSVTSANDYGTLANTHLFGSAVETAAPVVFEATEDAPDTRLNLKLRATVTANDQKLAHAIIADGAGKEQVYFVSDAVPGGATLQQIETGRVLLNRGGVIEALRLPRDFKDTAAANRNTSRTVRKKNTSRKPNIQQLVTQNASTFTEIIRPQPFMPNGQLKGYRVFPGRNRQKFMSLGLRPGDLVTEVNGIVLTDAAQGAEIFGSLSDSGQVNLTVERNGRPQLISLDMNQILSSEGGQR